MLLVVDLQSSKVQLSPLQGTTYTTDHDGKSTSALMLMPHKNGLGAPENNLNNYSKLDVSKAAYANLHRFVAY